MLRRISLALLALVSYAVPVRAQGDVLAAGVGVGYIVLSVGAIRRLTAGSDDVRLGSAVRATIRTPSGTSALSGSLLALSSDSITVSVDSMPRRFARTDVRSFSVYRGTEQKWAQGWAVGFVSGAAIGGIAGLSSGDDNDTNDWFNLSAKQKGLFLGAFGAFSGSLIGSAIGAAVGGERWDELDRLPMTPSVSIVPLGGRAVAVGAHLRF